MGISLGSWVAVRLARDFPGRVERIVIVAPTGVIPDRQVFETYVAGMRTRRNAAAAAPTWESIRIAFAHLLLYERKIIDDLIAVRLDIYSNPELRKVMPHLLEIAKGEHSLEEEDWRALPNEILAIKAVDKQDMFLLHADRISELAPGAKVAEIRNCDHWAQFEQPEIFNRLTVDFLAHGHRAPERQIA